MFVRNVPCKMCVMELWKCDAFSWSSWSSIRQDYYIGEFTTAEAWTSHRRIHEIVEILGSWDYHTSSRALYTPVILWNHGESRLKASGIGSQYIPMYWIYDSSWVKLYCTMFIVIGNMYRKCKFAHWTVCAPRHVTFPEIAWNADYRTYPPAVG